MSRSYVTSLSDGAISDAYFALSWRFCLRS